ncbi:MAG TPA: SDR family oxidoreductase [Cyclobacteriaceae bacterium]|nr:SDR family oxidoreductase [Cyclobacteriaceae bacterium]
MDLGLKNKVAFVSASSQGLGKSVALELAKEGAKIIICGRNQALLKNTADEIRALGAPVLVLEGDLSSAADCKRFIESSLKEFGTVDILVTNTGGPPTGKFESFEQADWDKAFQQLISSVVALIKGFTPGMKQKKWGRIISITSQAVKQPVNNLVLSNAVRSSIVGLMKTLASEFGEHNITVNNVMPGYTQTQRLINLIESNPAVAKVVSEIPLGRFGKPDEFGAAVAFLASERASYITGVSLAIDGGWIKGV